MTKQLVLILLTVFLSLTVSSINGQNLTAKFYNKTGYDIDSLVIRNTLVGHISKDSSTTFLAFPDGFYFDKGIPLVTMKGIIQSKTIQQYNWVQCRTGLPFQTEGKFIYDILIREFSLILRRHE